MVTARMFRTAWVLPALFAVTGCADDASNEIGSAHLNAALVSGTRSTATASLTRLIANEAAPLPLTTSLFPSSGGRLHVTVTRTRTTAGAVDILLDGELVGSVPGLEAVATLLVDGASAGSHAVTLRERGAPPAQIDSFTVVVVEQH